MNSIFSLVGPSGCGKTSIIEGVVQRIPEQVGIILSTTTRPKRNDGELRHYRFITPEEFCVIENRQGFVNSQNFAGQCYGTDRSSLNKLLGTKHGIWAIVEPAFSKLVEGGYDVKVVRIVPREVDKLDRPERILADLERSKVQIPVDLTIVNSFRPGGLEQSIDQLCQYITKLHPK